MTAYVDEGLFESANSLLFWRTSRAVRAVEPMALELNGHGGIDLSNLPFTAVRAYGDRVVIERLLLGEVEAAVLATIMIRRQSFSSRTVRMHSIRTNRI